MAGARIMDGAGGCADRLKVWADASQMVLNFGSGGWVLFWLQRGWKEVCNVARLQLQKRGNGHDQSFKCDL
jgi:hypothetical protein